MSLAPFERLSLPGTPSEHVVLVCDIKDRLDMLKRMDIVQLNQVSADSTVQGTVRSAALRLLRHKVRQADVARKSTRGRA